jgi:hypothetical protein
MFSDLFSIYLAFAYLSSSEFIFLAPVYGSSDFSQCRCPNTV